MTKPPNNSTDKALESKKHSITIRMYRSGFGDCFLLAFPANDNTTKYLLIDCGVHHNYQGKKELMKKIATQIRAATKKHIDVIAVTHEHTDHILGFNTANDVFKEIKFDRVWMGWTEKYNDPKVKELDKKRSLYLRGLHAASEAMKIYDNGFSKRLKSVLGYYDDKVLEARGGSQRRSRMYNRDTMLWLQRNAKKGTTFCYPGVAPLTIDGVDDVRIFVFGPPTDEGLLKKSSPSGGSKKETYLTDGPTEMFDSFVNSVLSIHGVADSNTDDNYNLKTPFTERYGKRLNKYSNQRKPAGADSIITSNLYYQQNNSWRAIDNEWMDLAAELAIKMDSHTNNSSLVLAIELGKNGKVLLFPGDAQVGNWVSWRDLEWKIDDEVITADNLLARTVLYKVGHHGSHNATLKAQGLEKMTNPELTALIPVDENFARDKQKWDIPYEELLYSLTEKCCNRVIRSDLKNHSALTKPTEMSSSVWKEFKKRLNEHRSKIQGDYIDYTVKW